MDASTSFQRTKNRKKLIICFTSKSDCSKTSSLKRRTVLSSTTSSVTTPLVFGKHWTKTQTSHPEMYLPFSRKDVPVKISRKCFAINGVNSGKKPSMRLWDFEKHWKIEKETFVLEVNEDVKAFLYGIMPIQIQQEVGTGGQLHASVEKYKRLSYVDPSTSNSNQIISDNRSTRCLRWRTSRPDENITSWYSTFSQTYTSMHPL